MRNWLGQDIEVGDVVGRGARSGSSSEFKVGRVSLIDSKGIQVEWLYAPGFIYFARQAAQAVWKMESKGRPDINSLFKLDPSVLDYCKAVSELRDEQQKRVSTVYPMTREEFVDRTSAL